MILSNKLKNVRHRVGLLLLLICLGTIVNAQQNDLVWYFNSKQKSEESNIKHILESLTKRNTVTPFFTNTVYLNSLRNNEDEEFEIRKQLDRFTENGVFARADSIPVNKALFQKLLGFSYFLRVELQTNIAFKEKEFTFSLYKAIPGQSINKTEVELAEIDLQSVKIENAKITATHSSEQIKTILQNAIKRLIPQLNVPPIAVISINNQDLEKYYSVQGKSFQLSGNYSIDEDTERENFHYDWRQISLDGHTNVPFRKAFALKRQTSTGVYSLPDTGVYQIGLVINDGIEDSKEDTLTIINSIPPKIILSKNRLRRKRKLSIFQYLNRRNSSKNIDDKISIKINSQTPLNYKLNYFEVQGKNTSKFHIQSTQNTINNYSINFKGKLKQEQQYLYGFYGKSADVYTDTSYYALKQSDLVFGRISIGFEPFIGSTILCVEPVNGLVWTVAPTSISGGLYLLHDRGASFLLEGGVLIFWKRNNADRVANGLGKVSLKVTTDFPKLAPYFALQVIGGPVNNDLGTIVNRRHFGLVLGASLFQNKLDVDFINMYYNPSDNCFSISGGIRYNFSEFSLF